MSTSDKPANPNRYKDNTPVFSKKHGWGRTFNPRVGSYMVDVNLGKGKIVSIHEDELTWPITYNDRCVAFGTRLAENGGLTWLYSPNDQLNGKSPRDTIENGDLELVEEVFERTFCP